MQASMVDLQYMRTDTVIGRQQIRETLSDSFHVPPEIANWFLETIEEREVKLQQLEREQYLLEMMREQ